MDYFAALLLERHPNPPEGKRLTPRHQITDGGDAPVAPVDNSGQLVHFPGGLILNSQSKQLCPQITLFSLEQKTKSMTPINPGNTVLG
jgi:hypothetical protein